LFSIFVFSLVLFSFFGFVFAYDFPGGDGSLEGPYQISSCENLNAIRDYSDAKIIIGYSCQ